MKILLATVFLAVFIFPGFTAPAENSDLEKGIAAFSNADYSGSLSWFRDVIINTNRKDIHSDAYFWIAKSYMALRQLDNAEDNLEFFIMHYPQHKYYQEAVYQKGRLMFLQDDYENCIQESYRFLENYPDSPFAANAYFWTAESLYSLGRLNDAEKLYSHIIYNYPSSYKVESANYRLSMIEQKYREESLVELLKLTHEEYLKAIEEFQVREKTYENALDSYQKKLSLLDSENPDAAEGRTFSLEMLDLQSNVRNKDNEIMALKRKIAELEYRLESAENKIAESKTKVIEISPEEKNQAISSQPSDILGNDEKIELLEIKSRALEIKSYYLKYLSSVGSN
ncbi:MAG: tetratricopeptide repeat protein [Spirochaetales bacterium]|nr:tetratricopeptide repeat protein [Spirochaetales bacterium]